MKRVAVTGMGIISPVGNDIDEYCLSLKCGKCGIGILDRFDTDRFKVKVAAQVRDFDPFKYGLSLKSVRHMDLFSQYAVAAASQAVASSGLVSGENIDPDMFGVYMGSGIGGIATFVDETKKLIDKGPERVSPYFITMLISNMASGHIAIEHRAQGACLPVVTACATSAHAIGEAYRAIAHSYATAIIAGGSEAAIEPLSIAGFQSCMALSLSDDPKKASLPFDARRRGFVMGEGAAALVLEDYDHAVSRGAEILGEITGYANTCDAHHVTAPLPDGSVAARAIRAAAEQSGLTTDDELYINAHGTGTALNDKSETIAISAALGDEAAKKARISSTKSMTGHMLGAAGAAEAVASVLALRHGFVPPTIGLDEPDPECYLNYTPNEAVYVRLTCALSISLGFGGHNACLAFRRA